MGPRNPEKGPRTPKLAPTAAVVSDFLAAVEADGRREDASVLLKLFQRATAFEPRMWGPSIVGFGSYHYRYDSGHEGDAPLAAFSPRKANMVVYLAPDVLEGNRRSQALSEARASASWARQAGLLLPGAETQ